MIFLKKLFTIKLAASTKYDYIVQLQYNDSGLQLLDKLTKNI